MIGKAELMEMAGTVGLHPHVVEKDYALGWALAGIFNHPELTDSWVFKGGTCLKKCYFETYRFSEDLDFTLRDETHLDDAFLQRVFSEISEWIYEEAGLEFPVKDQKYDIFKNPRGNLSCQGKLSYRGPVSPSSGGLPRIKLDLTADERLVLEPVRVPIYHPYSDTPDDSILVQAYAYEETFGEKVRALAERTRPRDLYDVINLYRNEEARPDSAELLYVLREKCAFKGIPVPKLDDLSGHRADLEGSWQPMLGHQLPTLPPLDQFWYALPEFFEWLGGAAVPATPAAYAMAAGDTVLRERTLRLPVGGRAQSHLEAIRFAAANRLCVDLDYDGKTRRIEPYSLRRTRDGNIILHAWSVDANAHRSYRVDRIQGARATRQTFTPRYAIELTPAGPDRVQSIPAVPSGRRVAPRMTARPMRRSLAHGPTHIFQCTMCGKKFRRKSRSSSLKPHKAPNGCSCPGRTGIWVDTQY